MNEIQSKVDVLAKAIASEILKGVSGLNVAKLLNGSLQPAAAFVASDTEITAKELMAAMAKPKAAKPKPSRVVGRESSAVDATLLPRLVDVLKVNPNGLRVGQIKSHFDGEQPAHLRAAISAGIHAGHIKKTGEKRATTYFARSITG